MRKRIATKLALLAMGLALVAATPQPMTVLNTLTELLEKPARYGETIIILGGSAPFDAPIRLAKHFTNEAYPINGTTTFPATNGGIWYLTTLGGSAQSGPVNSLAIACSDDGSVHDVSVSLYLGYYLLRVDQSASLLYPTINYIESSDGTSHRMTIRKDTASGVYSVAIGQGTATVAPQTLTFIADDTSEHIVTLTNYQGTHTFQVTQ